MEKRPTLLFLSHRLPFPPDNGASIRTYNVLDQLSREYDVTALCFDRKDRAKHGLTRADRTAALGRLARIEAFAIPQEESRARLLLDHARSVLSGLPYVHFVHDCAPFERTLKRTLAQGQFDLVHLDSLDLQRFLPLLRGLPVACTNHNVESELLARRAGLETGWRAAYLSLQAGLMRRAEARLLPKVDLSIVVSQVDQNLLTRIAPGARLATIPNGVDTDYYAPGPNSSRAGCIFVGGTTWYPNRDGLEWLSDEIVPLLRRLDGNANVTWVGRVTEAERARFGAPGLDFTGYVDDIRPHVHRAACYIAPLRVGGGTRVKIVDAWALGVPIVATRAAVEGLDARHGENVLLADTAADFAKAVGRVIETPELASRLAVAGRMTAEQQYGWTTLGERLRELYRKVRTGGGASVGTVTT